MINQPVFDGIGEFSGKGSPRRCRLELKEGFSFNYNFSYYLENVYSQLIPKGFSWDGSSIPFLAWLFVKFDKTMWAPSLIHDFYYYRVAQASDSNKNCKKLIDGLFLQIMISYGVSKNRACLVSFISKYLGWYKWGKTLKWER
jgi:hypothetical protein